MSRRLFDRAALAVTLAGSLALVTGCLGRVERTTTSRTLPFHASEDSFARYPVTSIEAPFPLEVSSELRFEPFVAYYPMPVGLAATTPAFNKASSWGPIQISPEPARALETWFGKVLRSGSGPQRVMHAVVTDFEWYMIGYQVHAGRIATQIVVTDESGAVVYEGTRVTRARVPFVDALFRSHVREWLDDPKLLAVLQGGAS